MVGQLHTSEFDAIVIGSGIGGLTTAAILAKRNHQRVLVLEQHFTPGGFTHSFERQGFHWDVGLHYVGQLGEGDTGKAVFDYLTDGKLQWQKMPPVFEKFVYPDFTFEVVDDPKQFQSDLIQQFPQEAKAIRQYFQDLRRASFWFGAYQMRELLPAWLQPLFNRILRYQGRIARQTTQRYLDRHFRDGTLKALLVSQWGDYGLPPAQSCFGVHALIACHYLQGGWYPVGGAAAIAQSMIPVIEGAGGVVLTQRRVTEILLEHGTAVGVTVQRTGKPDAELELYRAPVIISDAGAYNTYMKLIPANYPLPERQEIQSFAKGSSALQLFLGLKESPRKLGFQGENHWIYRGYDHNAIADESPDQPDFPSFCYLSFPSLKDPQATRPTAEIIAHIPYDCFARWSQQGWKKRDADYRHLKAQITEQLLDLVEAYYPGFRDLIEYAELATPLTVEHFDASDRGAIYNIPCVPERLGKSWIGSKTPIQNLYLTGSDAMSLGILGAMMGGVKTAGILTGGFGFFQIMATMMKESVQRRSTSLPDLERSPVAPV